MLGLVFFPVNFQSFVETLNFEIPTKKMCRVTTTFLSRGQRPFFHSETNLSLKSIKKTLISESLQFILHGESLFVIFLKNVLLIILQYMFFFHFQLLVGCFFIPSLPSIIIPSIFLKLFFMGKIFVFQQNPKKRSNIDSVSDKKRCSSL